MKVDFDFEKKDIKVGIDGNIISEDFVIDGLIKKLNETMPSLVFDDDKLDCAVFVETWEYKFIK